jgi:DNA-binding HxlR family transcriptional regulator
MGNKINKKMPQPEDVKYIQDTLYVIGGKWKLPILHSLERGIHKFRDIQRSIPNITSRMLAKELKELEMNGFITRTACDNIVDYEITDYCKSFEKIIKEMINWGKSHRSHIIK